MPCNSCYTALLDRAKVSTRYVKRLRSMLKFVCKTLNNEGPMYLNNMFTLNQNSHTRKHISLIQPIEIQYQEIWFQQYTLPRKSSVESTRQ